MNSAIWTFPTKLEFKAWVDKLNFAIDSYAYSKLDQKVQLVPAEHVNLDLVESLFEKKFIYVVRVKVKLQNDVRFAIFATNRLTSLSKITGKNR